MSELTANPGSTTTFGRVMPVDNDWLKRSVPEACIDPRRPIVDPHHHIWDAIPENLPNNGNDAHQPYRLQDYVADVQSGHNTVATIYMECHNAYRSSGPDELKVVGETEFAVSLGDRSESGEFGSLRVCQGIVGSADLTMGADVVRVLEAHIAVAKGRFRGVRASAGYHPDPVIGNTGYAQNKYHLSTFQQGAKLLPKYDLVLDAWVFFNQLEEIATLARACPDTEIVACHCGGPLGYGPYKGKSDEVFRVWRTRIKELAKHPNVTMKLGGMMIRLGAIDFRSLATPPGSAEIATLWGPYVATCIEEFGADRCMFESNFPVEKLGASWVTLWNAFKLMAMGGSEDEKNSLFAGTAKRVYRV